MKSFYFILLFLLFHKTNPRPLKKDPAFATPLYANSYLPAAMQVIFYAVEQLKVIQTDEDQTAVPATIPTTISHGPGQHQPESTNPLTQQQSSTMQSVLNPEASVVELENSNTSEGTPTSIQEMPELGGETPEANYGTPETNHEMPEEIHETQELNQENPVTEKDKVKPGNISTDKYQVSTTAADVENQSSNQSSSSSSSEEDEQKKEKQPTVDSVVKEIYGIMKPQNNGSSKDSSAESESKETNESNADSDEDVDDDDGGDGHDENKFTLLGEKVTQVPRPSLSNYLRRSKIPPKCSIQQLALLYDALSKDARKQGFAKFSGYSDQVLKTLQTSAEGGIGPQLQKLLDRILERNEVTRDDSKAKIAGVLDELNDPASEINRDLRHLLPLRFNP